MPKCKRCGTASEQLSRNKLCWDCGRAVQVEAITQMRNKSGPIYDKYLEGVRRYEASKSPKEDK